MVLWSVVWLYFQELYCIFTKQNYVVIKKPTINLNGMKMRAGGLISHPWVQSAKTSGFRMNQRNTKAAHQLELRRELVLCNNKGGY